MNTAQRNALGFSDLTQDECFLIALFREWRRIGPTRSIAEHRLACLLQADGIHPALDSLFRLFNELPRGALDPDDDTDLLSANEEALLDLLSDQDHPDKDLALIRECRRDIENSEMHLRPAASIERSGQDEVMIRIAESYQIMHSVLR